jgi:hypothetical protein
MYKQPLHIGRATDCYNMYSTFVPLTDEIKQNLVKQIKKYTGLTFKHDNIVTIQIVRNYYYVNAIIYHVEKYNCLAYQFAIENELVDVLIDEIGKIHFYIYTFESE